MVKNLPASTGDTRDTGSIPGSRRSFGGRIGNPTPVFLPGKFHGQRILVGYSPWSHKESDTIEATEQTHADVRGKVAQNHVSCNVSDGSQGKGACDKLLKIVLNCFLLNYVLPSAKSPSLS